MASASENDSFVQDCFGWMLDEAIDWIALHLDPEDVFTEDQLSTWADDKGYELTH